jgi:hypothetical protein
MDQTFPRAAVVRLAFLALLAAVAAWAAGCGGGGGTGERPSPQQPPAQQPPAQPPTTPTGPTGNPDLPPAPEPPPTAPESGKITFGTPGPWPVANALYGSAQGIRESTVVGITTDEAQNRWVATNTALYLFAPGATAPRRFTSADGLHLQDNPEVYCEDVKGYGFGVRQCPVLGGAVDPGIATIVGGRPNEVFVGYVGENDGSAASVGPNGIEGDFDDPGRHSGKIDWVRVNADGTLTVVRYDLVSVAHGMQFWHNRTIERLVFDHFVHPPSLYAGTNHGVDYLRPDLWRPQTPDPVRGFAEWVDTWLQEWMGDHLHAEAHSMCGTALCTGETGLLLGDWKGVALDANGDLWTAGRWAAGLITWDPSPLNWFQRNGAAFRRQFTSDHGTLPFPPPDGIVPGVNMSAVAVAPDGRVWFASEQLGLASWKDREPGFQRHAPGALFGFPDDAVRDLVALPDGRLAVAHASAGIALWDPATGDVTRIRGGQGIPSDQVTRLEVDRMVDPPTLHVATRSGAAALRVLP